MTIPTADGDKMASTIREIIADSCPDAGLRCRWIFDRDVVQMYKLIDGQIQEVGIVLEEWFTFREENNIRRAVQAACQETAAACG